MNKKTQLNRTYWILLICITIMPVSAWAQSTFDLTSVEPDVVPAGVTIEWHSALPVGPSNLYASPETAVPGLYYAVFNYGNDCYSAPSPLRVGKTSCASPTADLTQLVDQTLVPAGTEVTYHTASPAADANRLAGNASAATPGKYYVAYRDQTSACYSNTTGIVVLSYEADPDPIAAADSSLNNVLGTGVSVSILANDTLSNGSLATPGPGTVMLTNHNLPAGSTVNPDGTVTAHNQGTWSYDQSTGNLTFQPLASFKDNPKPLTYQLTDSSNCKVSESVAKITYEGAMPVTLVSFEARMVENQVHLTWRTSEEINASHFEIQRSADAKNFRAIANVPANNVRSSYEHVDEQPLTGNSYYRLRMVDLDSTFAYSRIVDVKLTNGSLILIYPNPAKDQIRFGSIAGEPLKKITEVKLYDLAGRLRYSSRDITDNVIDVSRLSDGLYMVSIVFQNGTSYESRIVLKK